MKHLNNALAGRMPGLLVNQFNGGEPGNDAAQLNIRGKSTYGKSDVIMIVDGIERDMSYLSPDEIERMLRQRHPTVSAAPTA